MLLEKKLKLILNNFNYKLEIVNNLIYLLVDKNDISEVLKILKQSYFQVLIDYFATNNINNGNIKTIYYHLLNYENNQDICVYTNVKDKSIKSIVDVFENADWYEREIYEMYNINFIGHNNLKKLFT